MEDYNSKYTGAEVEALLDQMNSGQSNIFLWNWNMTNSGQLGDGEFNKLKESSIVLIGAGASDANYYVPMVRSADDDSIVLSVHTASSEGLGNLVFSFNANGSWTMETEELAFVTEDQLDGKQDAITDLDAIRSGAEKGATALQSIPSEYVTETELNNKGYATTSALNGKVDKVSGKGLSTEDFTTALKTKLEGLSNYDDTELSEALSTLRGDFDELVSGDTTTAIKTFNEVIAFLDGVQDTQDLSSIIASIEQQIAGKMDKVTLATVATSGSYNDLSNKPTIPAEQVNADWNATSGKAQILNKPTIPTAVTESTVSGWGFTKNTGTYSKPSGGIPKSDLASAVQTSLGKADTAVQPAAISDFVTIEDFAAVATSGSYNDLTDQPDFVTKDTIGVLVAAHAQALYDGNNVYALPSSANGDEDDILVSERNLKTINGQSLVGSGDIEISGGGSSSGKEYVEAPLMTEPMGTSITFTPSVPLEPNKVYVAKKKVSSINMSRISIPSDSIGAEYTIMFQTSTSELPISVSNMFQFLWADGATPTIEADTYYELSLVVNRMGDTYDTTIFKVVLTPFKQVE